MAMQQARRFCRDCGRNTLHQRSVFGAGWGLLLSVLTLGLFLPVWLILWLAHFARPWRCHDCGRGRLA